MTRKEGGIGDEEIERGGKGGGEGGGRRRVDREAQACEASGSPLLLLC